VTRTRVPGSGRPATPAVFARATRTYWTSVFPQVGRELAMWRERAREVPDPALRAQALEALGKRGNMEGAAAFATFVPRPHRAAVVRATVAFQSAYNHLDTISEQSGAIGPGEARALHEALLAALACVRPGAWSGPSRSGESGHDHARPIHPQKNDENGYLAALVETCQEALSELPSYALVAPAARRAAERVVWFQALNRHEREAIQRWGREQTPPGSDLRWWETAASGGSSLGVHVMIAAAAEPGIDKAQVDALERAYFPWIGALHSMLDQLIDIEEDASSGQPNLMELYGSAAQAAERMALLAERALECARTMEPTRRHELIVAAMASFYLSAPEARVGEAAPVTRAVLDVFGGLAWPALAVFQARRGLSRFGRRFAGGRRVAQGQSTAGARRDDRRTAECVYYACREHGSSDRRAPSLTIAAGHR
jgi:tetraprenyl-beta-curcumene synthase